MSITFAPVTTAADITVWEAECYADYTTGPVVVVSEATHAEAVVAASAHKLLCQECDAYGIYTSGVIPGMPELNVANGNGAFLLNLLGVPFDYSGSISATELAERIAFASVVGGGDPGTDTIAFRMDGGATMIDCGRRPGYTDDKLAQLAEVVAWAVEHGRDVQWS